MNMNLNFIILKWTHNAILLWSVLDFLYKLLEIERKKKLIN